MSMCVYACTVCVCVCVRCTIIYVSMYISVCLQGNRDAYFEIADVGMDHFYPVEAKVECL